MDKIHFDIRISGFTPMPGIKLKWMRIAELYHISGFVRWGKDNEIKIEAEGKESDLILFINSIKDISGIENKFRFDSQIGDIKGFREFSIIDY